MKRAIYCPSLVSIIVVNWNGIRLLEDCLASLERQSWREREFILVDNGSTDGSVESMKAWTRRLGRVEAIYLSRNTGFCQANNLGFAKARGEWIALFNNDAIAEPTWLEELVRHGDVQSRFGMLGSKILFVEPQGVMTRRDISFTGMARIVGAAQWDETPASMKTLRRYSGRMLVQRYTTANCSRKPVVSTKPFLHLATMPIGG